MKQYISILLSVFLFSINTFSQNVLPYKNKDLPINKRVDDLLSRMTLEEKINQLNMKSLNNLSLNKNNRISAKSLEKLFSGESIGCLESPFIEAEKIAIYSEAADHYLRTKTRLGIPAIQIAECLHGYMALGATIFPQAIAMGSSWNPSLVKKVASTIAEEASYAGVDQALSPLFDLARDPRYGRMEECYGEDAYLVKEMGVAFVTGMQGNANDSRKGIKPDKLACTVKHFTAYSVPQNGINLGPNIIGKRALRSLHLYPFKAAIKEANAYSLMPGYHEIDGIPVHASHWLLTDLLRQEWGFKGYVFSDYSAISMLYQFHKTSPNAKQAGLQAFLAGVDLEAPSCNTFKYLEELVQEKKIDLKKIDIAVRRILRTKFLLGLFDRPYKRPITLKNKIHTKRNINLAQHVAEESIVLLKNKQKTLPLDLKKIRSIAVIGPNANKVQFGDYSVTKNNAYGETLLQGIRKFTKNKITINYAEGCGITNLSKANFTKAIEQAKKSDLVIMALGGTSSIISGIGWGDENSKEKNTSGEGFDRNELGFPGVQKELLEAIFACNKPIILVMINGRAMTIEKEVNMTDAILEAWYPGEKGGSALANILFGKVNPSGHLSVTFPKTTGHIPVNYDYKPSARGYYKNPGSRENPGRDYVFSSPDELFCFGHGLSYTSFKYSKLHLKNIQKEKIDVFCNIENTGNYDGAEVVQLYVRDRISSVTTPVKALKAFQKIYLKKGETKTVHLCVKKEDLKLYDQAMNYILEPGFFDFFIGSSSNDIRLKTSIKL